MSDSLFVCWRDGAPVTTHRGSWRHALGGNTGAIPEHKKHRPVVIERTLYEWAFAPDTPPEASRKIAALMKAEDERVNGPRARGKRREK